MNSKKGREQELKAVQGEVGEKIPKTPNRLQNSQGNGTYRSKVKCLTLQPVHNSDMKNRIMLGLKYSKDNSCYDYEQRSTVDRQKASKPKEAMYRKKNAQITCMAMQELNFNRRTLQEENHQQKCNISVEDQRDKQNKEKIYQENSVIFYNSHEQNEESSKALIESLGSWINDLFSVPSRSSHFSSTTVKNEFPKDLVLEEDPEYLKSISAIKEQFRKKLKSETSIQLSVPDKPFSFNFDKDLDSSKRNKRNAKSLPSLTPMDWIELNDLEEQIAETSENSIRRYNPNFNATGLIIRTNDLEDSRPVSKDNRNVREISDLLLTKKKKAKGKNRHDISDLEEYIFPTQSELSKRILLNVNENDKCAKFYKNSHLGVQESQHYGQRKGSKSHQTNARCYTTNATPRDRPRFSKLALPGNGFSQYCTTSASIVRGTDDILRRNSMELRKNHLRKPTKKEILEISRDSMTFVKVKSPKLVRSLPMESTGSDPKTSSDELVKYLIKKIKTTRPQHPKKRGRIHVPQLLGNPKNRFMQSATNTLVSVMSKNEENQLPAKSVPRVFPEPRLYPTRELILKNTDTNIRLDVSRAISTNKFSRLSYLLEDNKVEDDSYLLDRSSYGNTKRPYDDILKRETRKHSSKFNRRQEVKNILSKIDAKFNVFQTGKQKEQKRVIEEIEIREEQNARFQKQHEQFKTNLKLMQQTVQSQEAQNDVHTEIPSLLSTELAVIDTESQSDSDNLQQNSDEQATAALEQQIATPANADCKVDEFLHLDYKSPKQKAKVAAENSAFCRDKTLKTKSLQFLKETDSKVMLNPLEKLYMLEQNPRDTLKAHEIPPLCPTVGQVKLPDMVLLNPRYSSNSLIESNQKSEPASWCSPPIKTTLFLSETEKDVNGDKREAKEKKKVKTPRMTGTRGATTLENACGFDKVKKKPGPNCEKEE